MADNYLKTFLKGAGKMPGIRIDRHDFLWETFGKGHFKKQFNQIALVGPLAAGVSPETVGKKADKAIRAEKLATIALSAAAGAPGGPIGWALIPADIAQFYAHSIRVIQILMYLYGWQEDVFDEAGNLDDASTAALVLYLGVMCGVGAAGKVLTNITAKAAVKNMTVVISKKTLERLVGSKAIFMLIEKIMQMIGIKISTQITLKVPAKAIPLWGAVASAICTAAFFIPASNRLKKFFETGELERLESEALDSKEEDEIDIEGLI